MNLTPLAVGYLAAQQKAARTIERRLRTEFGEEDLASLYRLAETLGGDEEVRTSDYLRKTYKVHDRVGRTGSRP